MTVTIPNSEVSADYNISELTSGELGGNGTFDIIMGAVNAHIDHQFKLGRIRGTDFANTYIQAMQMALQQASSYAIAKAKLPLELQQLEAQNHKIATDIAVMTKQGALYDAQILQTMAQTEQVKLETTKKVPAEIEQIRQQTDLIKEQTRKEIFETDYVLPKQLEQTDAQIAQTTQQTANMLSEKARIETETSRINYEVSNVLPKQLQQTDAQIAQLTKDTQLKEYELVNIKPLELENARTEVDIKQQQIEVSKVDLVIKQQQIEVSKADLAIKQQQLELAKYQFTYQAPSEVAKTKSEADYYRYRAINEQAQTDPSVVMAGSTTALNNALIKEQSRQFMRSAQQGFLSEMIGSWKVRYNADPDAVGNGVDDENKLNDAYIGKVLSAYATELGITL